MDPGTRESALVCLDEEFQVQDHWYLDNHDMFGLLEDLSNPVDHFAVEWLQSYGFAVGQDVFQTCRWVGRFEIAWDYQDNIFFYARPSILTHVRGGTKKGTVRQALMLRFGGTKKGEPLHGIAKHEWDALAAGIYHIDARNTGKDLVVDWSRIVQ